MADLRGDGSGRLSLFQIEEITWHLKYLPPPPTSSSMAGFDAMTILLRRIYATKAPVANMDQFRDEEGKCAIMRYAWRDFEPPDPNEAEMDDEADKKDVLRQMGLADTASFADISLNVPIWATRDFDLWKPLRRHNGSQWVPSRRQARRLEKKGLVTVDCSLPGSLQSLDDHIDAQFGKFKNELWISAEPTFVRVLYSPSEEPWTFQDLWRFNMPLSGNFEGGIRPRFSIKARHCPYIMVAAVRLRTAGATDYVRTFSTDGVCLKPTSYNQAFDDGWKFDDKPCSSEKQWYVLLYQRTPAPGAAQPWSQGKAVPDPPLGGESRYWSAVDDLLGASRARVDEEDVRKQQAQARRDRETRDVRVANNQRAPKRPHQDRPRGGFRGPSGVNLEQPHRKRRFDEGPRSRHDSQ